MLSRFVLLLFLAVWALSSCDTINESRRTPVTVWVTHDDNRPAADVPIEALGENGSVLASVATDINGRAEVTLFDAWLDVPRDHWNVRAGRTETYLGIPIGETRIRYRGERNPGAVQVTFRPLLAPGDTWFQPLLDEEAELQRHGAGESVTVNLPVEPRHVFVVSGNDIEGVRHAQLLFIDGRSDMLFSDPLVEPAATWGNTVTVAVTGIAAAPTCRHLSFPLEGETAALVYPKSATGFTVWSLSRDILPYPGAAGKLNQPSALVCSFVGGPGPCAGTTITSLVPLLGSQTHLGLDWSSPRLIPFSSGQYTLRDARIVNDSSDAAYLRDKGGFCVLPSTLGIDWGYLFADLTLANGNLHYEQFYPAMPASIEMALGEDPAIETRDEGANLVLSALCPYCYLVAQVTGEQDGKPVSVVAPIVDGVARVPLMLFDRRDDITVFGYARDFPYAEVVTLPMRGYGPNPGATKRNSVGVGTRFFRWTSER